MRPGGALVYVTCSVFPEENEDQAQAFLAQNKDFTPELFASPAPCRKRAIGVQFTPHLTGTDGFYVCRLRRAG